MHTSHNKFMKTIVAFAVLVFLIGMGSTVHASTLFSFAPVDVNVTAGEVFQVAFKANPEGQPIYTVAMNVAFPADLIQLKTWTFNDAWIPLRQPGYDVFSNTSGTLIRTAGYPDGFTTVTDFGTAVFVAKKTGTGTISFTGGGIALDAQNTNRYAGGNQLSVKVVPAPVRSPVVAPGAASTTSPTNINPPSGSMPPIAAREVDFSVDAVALVNSSDLTAHVSLNDFATSTPVTMTFAITDHTGSIVYTTSTNATVSGQTVIGKKFDSLDLPVGDYTLHFFASFASTTIDRAQAFEILPILSSGMSFSLWVMIGIGVVVIIIALIVIPFLLKKRRNKNSA